MVRQSDLACQFHGGGFGRHAQLGELIDGGEKGTAAAAHGGQTLVSDEVIATVTASRRTPSVTFETLGHHRLTDLSEPVALRQVRHPGLLDSFPPLRTLDRVPNNLPLTTTSFVGRHDEVVALAERVVRERIVTLTGSAGVGKTRLALQVAAHLSTECADGAWFADLEPVAADDLVAGAVGHALEQTRQLAQEQGDLQTEASALQLLTALHIRTGSRDEARRTCRLPTTR